MSGTVPPPAQTWVSHHPGAARRLSGAVALMAAAGLLRGTGGVLLGIVAALLLLDAVVPMPAGTPPPGRDRLPGPLRPRPPAPRLGPVGGGGAGRPRRVHRGAGRGA